MVRINLNDTFMTIFEQIFVASTKEQSVMVGLMCWSLWVRMNKWLWDKINMSTFGIKAMALNLVSDWKRATQTEPTNRAGTTGHCKTWTKQEERWVKINLDASYYEERDRIGIGYVVRDE